MPILGQSDKGPRATECATKESLRWAAGVPAEYMYVSRGGFCRGRVQGKRQLQAGWLLAASRHVAPSNDLLTRLEGRLVGQGVGCRI